MILLFCYNNIIIVQGSSIPANLSAILKVYEINTPPPNVTVKQLFDRIIGKVQFWQRDRNSMYSRFLCIHLVDSVIYH